MIMIAKDGEHAMAGAQLSQQFGAGGGILAFFGNVITGERHDVRLQAIGCLHRTFDLCSAGEWTVVDIRELNYAKTVKCFWQTAQTNLVVLDRQSERLT
jgi:hypothetical protein